MKNIKKVKQKFLSYKNLFLFLIIFGGFLFFSGEAMAATYYVSTTGTDDASHGTGAGTDAWLTLDYALRGDRVSGGDTIKMETGIYNSFYSTNTYIYPSVLVGTGESIVIEAYNGVVTQEIPNNSI